MEDFIKKIHKTTNDNLPTTTYSIFSNQLLHLLSEVYEKQYNNLKAVTQSSTQKKIKN